MKLFIAILGYYLGIDKIFYFLNRKAKRIVTFHNVMPAALLPGGGGKRIGLTDTEESFAMKIAEIKKHFTLSTDIFDARTLTVTFDDGYRNEYEIVRNVAGDEFKGIIFASGRVINNNNPHDALIVDLLMHWTELIPDGMYSINHPLMVQKEFVATAENRQWLWQNIIYPSYVADASAKGHRIFKAINKAYSLEMIFAKCSPEYLRQRLTGFTLAEIKAIRKEGWIVGWHTDEHFPLSKLSREQKCHEISEAASKEMLHYVLSYPYGEMQAVDAECIEIANTAGYPCAVSNLPDPNTLTGRFFLPRFTLPDNKYLLHFELSGLKYFLKNRKLLKNYL